MRLFAFIAALAFVPVGCGTTTKTQATEQMVLSDAVDRAVARLDLTYFDGQKIFLDTRYVRSVKGAGFVNADYITSSLRQQAAACGCLLQDSADKAEYVIEARVGALGADNNAFSFGIPSSQSVGKIASLVQNAPPIPAIPEISFARRADQRGAAKIGLFAYHRETRQPVWQSELSNGQSTAKDIWVLGAGPLRSGTIQRRGVRFDGLGLSDDKVLSQTQMERYYSQRTDSLNPYPGIKGGFEGIGFDPKGIAGTGNNKLKAPVEPKKLVVPASHAKPAKKQSAKKAPAKKDAKKPIAKQTPKQDSAKKKS